jgi:hypothetical protein
MRLYKIYLLLQSALHISSSEATHHQEHIQLYSQHLVLVVVYELLPSAIVVMIARGSSSIHASRYRDHDSGR